MWKHRFHDGDEPTFKLFRSQTYSLRFEFDSFYFCHEFHAWPKGTSLLKTAAEKNRSFYFPILLQMYFCVYSDK